MKAGAKVPDISTPEKFRAALLAAKGVAYADPGRRHLGRQGDRRHAEDARVQAVKRVPVQGLAATALANGTADIALQLLPELAADKDVALAGPVPEILWRERGFFGRHRRGDKQCGDGREAFIS